MLCAWNAAVSERISALCAAWKRSSFLTRVVSVAFVGIFVAYASNKPPENEQEGRYLCLISSLPEGRSEESAPDPRQGETILTREWNLPDAWEYSMRRQDFANGFVFPYGTNHLACVHVSSQGYLCESRFSTNVIASIGVPAAVVPGLTECSHAYTVSNTYLFSWTNAAVNRDTNTLVSASLELLRNGDIYFWGRTHSPCVRGNKIHKANYRCDSRLRSGYGRFEDNTYSKGVHLGENDGNNRTDNWDYVLSGLELSGADQAFNLEVGCAGRLVNCTFKDMPVAIANAYACTFENCTDGSTYKPFPGGNWFEVTLKNCKFNRFYNTNNWDRCHFVNTQLNGFNRGSSFVVKNSDFTLARLRSAARSGRASRRPS